VEVPNALTKASPARIVGYDLARFFAIVAMVLVNYRVVLAYSAKPDSWVFDLANHFTGRAAALFVVLAGIGLSLLNSRIVIVRRALFLLVIGYLWQIVWSGDILHYYGFYLLCSAWCLNLSKSKLLLLAVICGGLFPLMAFLLEGTGFAYGAGWEWAKLEYRDFWTPVGQLRNLLFNGWHPLLPWLSFLFFGMALGKLNLEQAKIYKPLMVISLVVYFLVAHLSEWATALEDTRPIGAQITSWWLSPQALWGTSSVPPGPLYVLSAASTALFGVCACLWICSHATLSKLCQPLVVAGQMALTLYISHILFGLYDADVVFVDLNSAEVLELRVSQVGWRTLQFVVLAVLLSNLWRMKFRHGPLEWLMRKFS